MNGPSVVPTGVLKLPSTVLQGQPVRLAVPATPPGVENPVSPSGEPRPVASPGVPEAEVRLRVEAALRQGAAQAQEAARVAAQQAMESQLARRLERINKAQADKWHQLAKALAGQMAELRERLEADIAQAVFVATCRLLGESLVAKDRVLQQVQHVLAEAGMPRNARVLLCPEDFAELQAALELAPEELPAGVSFDSDSSVAVGGCRIETPEQHFDARLEVQLALLHAQLQLRGDAGARANV